LRLRTGIQLGLAALLTALIPAAHAGERVTLTNGFAMVCNHHAEVDGRVRLYMNTGEASYIELRPTEVANVELVPDPPSSPTPTSQDVANANTRLSPAELHEVLSQAGRSHNLDVDLLASVVKAESGGNSRAVSRAGARGLMQLMPKTASNMGVEDSFQPDQNVGGGSTYLDTLLTRYHENLVMALAAYNAGPAAVDKYHGIPPYSETQVYVARVIHEFNRRVRVREAQKRLADAIPSSQGTK
jgi:soluble lytic murein transglycosylase-like protein